jgi:hypothetical protein
MLNQVEFYDDFSEVTIDHDYDWSRLVNHQNLVEVIKLNLDEIHTQISWNSFL